ncbi:MAG: hypothetical protein IJF66_05125 [Clostridia bacterium]|nr:hypothetical protein [Clostridia bacterium]
MTRKITHGLAIFLLVITVISIGGVYATFTYSIDPPHLLEQDLQLKVEPFTYLPGANEMVSGEVAVTERFVAELNKIAKDKNSTELDEIIEARKDKGSAWWPINELAADDPEASALREILGIDEYPELTVIIKFLNSVPAYELYTTRVDVDAKDKDGNYIIPEEEFVSETTFLYPVNRTTFTVLADGTYSAKEVTVGYSRAIYYYETPTQQSTTRTYDVSTWAEGISFNTAITMESGIIGKVITVQNIDQQKEVYFKFTVNSNANYTFTPHVEGLTAQVYNSSQQAVGNSNANGWSGRLTGSAWGGTTYYLKLVYNTDTDPTDMKFTFSR